jgi:hypothetical protein
MNNTKENDTNIFFSLEEKNDNQYLSEVELQYLINELEEEYNNNTTSKNEYKLEDLNLDKSYYNECNLKELLKICQYYGLDKISRKFKKNDYIQLIISFESIHENYEVVERRIRFWNYMIELKNDPIMKKYLIWD